MKKKIICLFLCMALCFSLSAVAFAADEGAESSDLPEVWDYNGYRLPALPDYDSAAFSYAMIFTAGAWYLMLSAEPVVAYDGNAITFANNTDYLLYRYDTESISWLDVSDGASISEFHNDYYIDLVWANYSTSSFYSEVFAEPVVIADYTCTKCFDSGWACDSTGWSFECFCCPHCHSESGFYLDFISPHIHKQQDVYLFSFLCLSCGGVCYYDKQPLSLEECSSFFAGSEFVSSGLIVYDGYPFSGMAPDCVAAFEGVFLDSISWVTYDFFHGVVCPDCGEVVLFDFCASAFGEGECDICSSFSCVDLTPASLSTVTDATGTTLVASLGWVKQIISVIADKPILFVGIALPVIGAGVVIFRRLRRL